jgi:hypothetical protein
MGALDYRAGSFSPVSFSFAMHDFVYYRVSQKVDIWKRLRSTSMFDFPIPVKTRVGRPALFCRRLNAKIIQVNEEFEVTVKRCTERQHVNAKMPRPSSKERMTRAQDD